MFKLEITPRITKELLLERNTQETYFEHYLGVPVKKGLFRSPDIIRSDKNPTCSFYKNSSGTLIYKDFAGPSFDFISCVQHLYNVNYYNALRIIANDFGIIEMKNVPKNPPKIEYTKKELSITTRSHIGVELKNFTEKELKWWGSFGITKDILKQYNVFSLKNIFLNGNYFSSSTENIPIYGYFGGFDEDQIELWRIYMPTKRTYRFMSNWPAIKMQGARQLLKAETLIITKSLKDVMTLRSLGLNAIAPTSETTFIGKEQIARLKLLYKNIFVLYDNDLAGVKNANKYLKHYKIPCIFIKRKYSKDFSDLYKKYSLKRILTIVEELEGILKDKEKETKHFYIFYGRK